MALIERSAPLFSFLFSLFTLFLFLQAGNAPKTAKNQNRRLRRTLHLRVHVSPGLLERANSSRVFCFPRSSLSKCRSSLLVNTSNLKPTNPKTAGLGAPLRLSLGYRSFIPPSMNILIIFLKSLCARAQTWAYPPVPGVRPLAAAARGGGGATTDGGRAGG